MSASNVAVTLENSCFILEGRFSSITGLQQDYCLDAEFVPMSNIEGYLLKIKQNKTHKQEAVIYYSAEHLLRLWKG